MLRLIGGTIAGIVTWIVVVTALNLILRYGWAEYAAVEHAMTFTTPMMIARLAMSAISSLAGGAVAAGIARRDRAALASGVILLLLLFVPEHYLIWDHFPIWYHLTFLASLPLLAWAGGRIMLRRSAAAL